jgi:hypothetical protein
VTLIKPAGFAGRVADPAVAVVLLVKFRRFKKNNCHARVGRPDWSDKGDVGIL